MSIVIKKWLLRILTFGLPLIFWTNPLRFELAKTIYFLSFSFFILLTIFLINPTLILKYVTREKWYFFWVFILSLSSFLNQLLPQNFIGVGYHHQGLIFFIVLGLLAGVFSETNPKEKQILAKGLGVVFVFEALLTIFITLLSKFNINWLIYQQFTSGTIGEHNQLAGFLVFGLPLVFHFFGWIFIIPLVIAIFLTGSKIVLGILFLQLFLYLLWQIKLKEKMKNLFSIALIMLFFVFSISGVVLQKTPYPFENRWNIWQLGAKAVTEKPFLGYGAEGIIEVYKNQFLKQDIILIDLAIDRSHNFFLDLLLFSGVFGTFFFLKWLIIRLKNINYDWQKMAILNLFLFFFFQPIGTIGWFYLFFFLFI